MQPTEKNNMHAWWSILLLVLLVNTLHLCSDCVLHLGKHGMPLQMGVTSPLYIMREVLLTFIIAPVVILNMVIFSLSA